MWRRLTAQKTAAELPRTATGEGARIGDCRPVHRPRIRGVLGSSAATFGLASSLLPRVKGEGGADLWRRDVLGRYCPGASPQQPNRQRTASTAGVNKDAIRTIYRRSRKRVRCRPAGTHRQRFTASGHTVGTAVFYLKGEMPT